MNPMEQLRKVKQAMNGFLVKSAPPGYPEYSKYNCRLATFNNREEWFTLNPEEMSEAGFYYPGHGNAVICYYCGGGIEGFITEDIIWEEHAYWFPKCILVRTLKGIDYIKKVQEKKEKELNLKIECQMPTANSNTNCKVCLENVAEILYLPCRHIASCRRCKLLLMKCPVCRQKCDSFIHVFYC
jgi:baculoviral IAP repeat-containing protein 7/8